MQNLKSKKFSLVILAVVLSLNWYVGVQAIKHDQYDASFSPIYMNAALPHMPSLNAMQLPSSIASGQLKNFHDRLRSIQELPTFAFTFTPHTDPAKSMSQQSMQQPGSSISENSTSTGVTNVRTPQSSIVADEAKTSTSTSTALADTHKSQSRQSGDLMKVLALYFMLNGSMHR